MSFLKYIIPPLLFPVYYIPIIFSIVFFNIFQKCWGVFRLTFWMFTTLGEPNQGEPNVPLDAVGGKKAGLQAPPGAEEKRSDDDA
jgi:hypothetical protein